MTSPSLDRRLFAAVMALALVVRCGVAAWNAEQLTLDRDAYLGIADNLVRGRGFCAPGTDAPTAYRPPLYPLLLAAAMTALPRELAVAGVNVVAGLITVWLVGRLARTLTPGPSQFLAALLVSLDPLLLNATAQPMTEVVFTCLTTAWLWSAACPDTRPLLSGVLFGLAALCRPTIWPLAPLLGLAWLILPPARHTSRSLRRAAWACGGALLVVSPWIVRNQFVFGTPILTTTHGGYTLLLANNPVHDQEVVRQPWRTTWKGDSLARWQADVERKLHADLGPRVSETARDAWMSAEAKAYIRREPVRFLHAALHRARSLWSLSPHGEGTKLPLIVRHGVAAFYGLEFLAAAVGLCLVVRGGSWRVWLPGLLLVAAVQGVHLVYWTDARMRTPLQPVIALLAAHTASTRDRQ